MVKSLFEAASRRTARRIGLLAAVSAFGLAFSPADAASDASGLLQATPASLQGVVDAIPRLDEQQLRLAQVHLREVRIENRFQLVLRQH